MKYILLAIITITLLGCGGAEERKAAYLEKADQSLKAGDLDKARIELKNVLQIDPKDARAFFKLGTVFEFKKNYQKAFGSYLKASELDPENLDYHAKLGRYYLLLAGDMEKAIEKRDLILGKDANDTGGLLLKAGVLLKQKDAAGARKIAQDIFARQPDHIETAVFLSTLYLQDKEYDSAIDVLSACVKKNPDNSNLKTSLANAYLNAGNYDEAEKQLKAILHKNPDVFSSHLKLAMFYAKVDKHPQAEQVLRDAVKADEEDSKRKIILVELIQQTRGTNDAITVLDGLVNENPDMGELRIAQGKLYVSAGDNDKAETIFKKAAADFSEDSVGIKSRVYLASLYMQHNDVDSAVSVIEDAIKISPNDSEVNLVNAKLLIIKQDYERAIISLRTVIKDDPENINAYLLLAASHNTLGENEQASEIMNRAFENNRANAKGLMELANYYAKSKNKTELERVVDSYLAIDSNNYDAMSYKAALLSERKLYEELKPLAIRMIENHPDKPNGYIQSVSYLLAENKRQETVELLDGAYDKVADNGRILELLVSLHMALKNEDAATEKINLAIREKSDDANPYLLKAKVELVKGDKAAAEASLNKALSIKPDWNEPYLALSNIYLSDNKSQKAIDILDKGLSVLKSDLKLTLSLAKIYEDLGSYNAAINEYDKAYNDFSENLILVNNLAALLSEHRTDTISLNRAKELADKLKMNDQPVILDTVGWVYYKTGNYADAVKVLQTVVEKAPSVSVFNYHLGMALYKASDEVSAKTYLAKSLESDTNFPGKEEAQALLKKLN